MKRYGLVIKVKPERLEEYKKLHANPWPEVLEMIKRCNLQNYAIYYRDGLLFTSYEYTGSDLDADIAKMGESAIIRKWWAACESCQEPVETAEKGQWWAPMEEVFYQK